MRPAYPVAAVRRAEAAAMDELADGVLMARASAGLAGVAVRMLVHGGHHRVYGARVVLLVGPGANGGDALFAGAALARRGAQVQACCLGPTTHAGGAAALREAGGGVLDAGDPACLDALGVADLVLDGILGIGGRPGLRPMAAMLVQAAMTGPGVVVAVDLPSGVDPDTGGVDGPAVRADLTVTFGVCKPGLLVDPGAGYAGVVELVDIGLGPYLSGSPVCEVGTWTDIAGLLPRPGRSDDKYSRGVLGVAAGSAAYTGAAVLAVGAALAAGTGMVRYAGPPGAADLVRARWPEAIVTGPEHPGQVQAWVVGPGLGRDDAAGARFVAALAADVPLLVDADGLTLLGELVRDDPGTLAARRQPTLLTPHAGELARLLDVDRAQVESTRLASVRTAADRFGATVLLKGYTTLVASPGRVPVWVNPTGTPELATAGSGDVLSGLAGALLAAGLVPAEAAMVAA
ncbi:MAG: NAD(P)H-hydrate dehydratase, partial [Actinomycetes bacterium]